MHSKNGMYRMYRAGIMSSIKLAINKGDDMSSVPTVRPQVVADGCQLCHAPFVDVLYDANIRGRWGFVCSDCFVDYGCRLGVGLGQKYSAHTREKLEG